MKAPDFWYQPPGLASHLLGPLGAAYHWAGRLRRATTTPLVLAGLPVVCVGNLVAGGAGKTPVTLALTQQLQSWGVAVHCLSRGYGGQQAGPLRVDPERHDAAMVGDEALLLAAAAPTWVARDRAAGGRAAQAAGAGVLVLDDGFQNPALAYRLALLVVDGTTGFGNRQVIPAGPLREPIRYGLDRASAMVVVGQDRTGVAASAGARPVFHARLVPDPTAAARLTGRRVVAFAGIGRPAKFFETLAELGADLIETIGFPDHHRYRPDAVAALLDRARRLNAVAVTTAKDAVRLPEGLRAQVRVLPVTLAWDDPPTVQRWLAQGFAPPHSGAHSDGQP